MIIFISDLHMCDGTAAIANLSPKAFVHAFTDMAVAAQRAKSDDITIVFLGDIYDLIRTEMWFLDDETVGWKAPPLDERPWGSHPSEPAAEKVMDAVIDKNPDVFSKILPRSYKEQFCFPEEPKRVYIPGNHDRLCNLYPSLRQRVCDTLGIPDMNCETTAFDNFFLDQKHAAFARHGHEWDFFNFGGSTAKFNKWRIPPAEYVPTPIGDVLACEVAAKLRSAVMRSIPDTYSYRKELDERLRDLFDIRPIEAIFLWLAFQVKSFKDDRVTNAINNGVREVVTEFENIPFVEKWAAMHLFHGGAMIEAMRLLKHIDLTSIEGVIPLINKFAAMRESDNFASKAADDFDRLDSDETQKDNILHVLYGHTHQPEQQAIALLGKAPDEHDRVYLNTGMWRPSHDQGVRNGFVTWKNLTYTILYNTEEMRKLYNSNLPSFEIWTGALKDC